LVIGGVVAITWGALRPGDTRTCETDAFAFDRPRD